MILFGLLMFQFTPVVRRATFPQVLIMSMSCFNSRPSCDGRPFGLSNLLDALVSIHARRATGDLPLCFFGSAPVSVSIHARRATGDLISATAGGSNHVSIHARRATGDCFKDERDDETLVSIHARRATGDFCSKGGKGE